MSEQNFSEIAFLKERLRDRERLLAIKQLQINSLLEITRLLNENLSIETLVSSYKNILHAQLGVSKIALFIKENDNWVCKTPEKLSETILNYNLGKKFSGLHAITPVTDLKDETLTAFEYLIPVSHKKEPIGYVLIGPFGNDQKSTKSELVILNEEKLKFIQTITNIIVVANENKKLAQVQLEQMMMQRELSLAADMQNMLIPASLPNNEKIEVAAFYKPHKDVGGDYYDFIQISDNEIAFCICDISGKGIPAALLMANFQANIRTLSTGKYYLPEFVEMLNKKVGEITKGEKFITLFLATYNYNTRLMTYINAGHNPSILLTGGEILLLDQGCTILGMFDQLPQISFGEVKVAPNAIVLNYTDGLSEAANNEGKLFETEGLISFLKENYQLELSSFNTKLIDHVIAYKQDNDFDDDITLLTLRFK